MSLTDDPRMPTRLLVAIEALTLAGAEKLPGRLAAAFEAGDYEAAGETLRQARTWASTSPEHDRRRLALRRIAGDAVGLLWATLS